MIKSKIPNQFLAYWFMKSLVFIISKYISMSMEVTREEMIYSQSRVFYDILAQASKLEMESTKPKLGPDTNGVICYVN